MGWVGLVFAAMLSAMLLAGLGCSAGAPAPQFQPQPVRGTLAQVWTIPSGCPSTLVTPSHTKGATFWANDTLWATYLRTRDADAQLLKRSLGGSPNATAIIGFELYLADSAVWGPEPLQRLALAIAHWRTQGIRPLLFLLDIEFSGKGTWSTTHDVVHDPQARAYLLSAVRTVLGAEGVSGQIHFVSAYWVGASARCNGRASVCTEAEITALIGDLQRIANDIGGATYLQHVDGPFWNSPGQNVSGYSARSLGQAQGMMAESWTMGTLAKGVGSLLAAGGATRDTLLLLNDVPNCDLDPTRPCSTGSVGSDTAVSCNKYSSRPYWSHRGTVVADVVRVAGPARTRGHLGRVGLRGWGGRCERIRRRDQRRQRPDGQRQAAPPAGARNPQRAGRWQDMVSAPIRRQAGESRRREKLHDGVD